MNNTALIIVDMQNDFCENGSLEVKKANDIIPLINNIRKTYNFQYTILTQDYHPTDHISFNNSPHLDTKVHLNFLTKKWKGAFPPHCVENTEGAKFHPELELDGTEQIFMKGRNSLKEEFSGFCNSDLVNFIADKNINRIFVVGVAYDFCVARTAIDGRNISLETYVIKDFSRSIGEVDEIEKEMESIGIKIISSEDLKKLFKE
jgi:nicotinamidase/pyrazinamidase